MYFVRLGYITVGWSSSVPSASVSGRKPEEPAMSALKGNRRTSEC